MRARRWLLLGLLAVLGVGVVGGFLYHTRSSAQALTQADASHEETIKAQIKARIDQLKVEVERIQAMSHDELKSEFVAPLKVDIDKAQGWLVRFDAVRNDEQKLKSAITDAMLDEVREAIKAVEAKIAAVQSDNSLNAEEKAAAIEALQAELASYKQSEAQGATEIGQALARMTLEQVHSNIVEPFRSNVAEARVAYQKMITLDEQGLKEMILEPYRSEIKRLEAILAQL